MPAIDNKSILCYNTDMELNTATDWKSLHSVLRIQWIAAGYNSDLRRLLNNITDMVSEFSKLEVDARRIHKDTSLVGPREQINQAIKRLDQLLLMALLMK